MFQPAQLRTVLLAVQAHPFLMSPVLLEHLLRGEELGRMREKGLVGSPYFGALPTADVLDLYRLIQVCVEAGWLARGTGFYPALGLTHKGEDQLAEWAQPVVSESCAERHYQAYYRWRQQVARRLRKPPYRIVTNATLNALAMRLPTSLESLLMVPGLGKRRALRYHEELILVGQALVSQAAPAEPADALELVETREPALV
jgi:superfamily II DNA helicase RecQ